MYTSNTLLLVAGLIVTIALYAFNSFFRERKTALLLFLFGWTVYIAGFLGTSFHEPLPLWSWIVLVGMAAGLVFGIVSEYRLWVKSKK
jgi:hypothetical protein